MSKTVLLVGHCGPDSSFLKNAIRRAGHDIHVRSADAPPTLSAEIAKGVDLVLLNRELGYDFDQAMGVDWIKRLKKEHPDLKTMLISNFPEAQAAAQAAGALPGFGKREIGSSRVTELLRSALEG